MTNLATNRNTLLYNSIVGLCFVFLLTGTANSQTRTPGPRIKIAEEVFDFGIVPQHGLISHVFWLRNTGDAELVVDRLITNCSCSQAPIDKKRVMPGDSTRVEMIFGSGRFDGPVKKFAQIVSNAVGRVPALSIRAHVVADSESTGSLRFEPRSIDLDKINLSKDGEGWVQRVVLKNSSATPLTVATIDLPDQIVRVERFKTTISPGAEHEIALRFASEPAASIISGSVTIEYKGTDSGRLTLPIFRQEESDSAANTADQKSKT